MRLYKNKDAETYVAIKFLERGEKITKYIASEVLNHRVLRHPHVIEFKEVFLTDDYICIAMEYASGGNLFSYVQKAGRLQEPAARWFFQQMIIGLDYCHRKGVVNRDIKLENTLLQMVPNLPLPLVKVCDFGYSKAQFMSAPKSKVGTLAYMAPEVIRSTGKYDGKLADIWSCGVMLYVMLFGYYPFDAPHQTAAQKQAAQEAQRAAAAAAAAAGGGAGGGAHDPRTKSMMERIMASQWAIPDSIPVTPACRDLLTRLMTADPAKRLTMEEIQRHQWFLFNLPGDALLMNDTCLATPDTSGLQSEEDVQVILRKAQTPKAGAASGLEDDHNSYEDMIDESIQEEELKGGSGCMGPSWQR